MIGRLNEIVLDTPDVVGLSAFYAEVAGVSVTDAVDDWVTTSTPEGWRIAFQQATDHVAPRWPDPAYPQQLHLDLLVPDLRDAVQRAEKAGATKLPGGGDTFSVLADPSGHPFCLCQRDGIESVELADVCVDTPNAAALAGFYAPLLGMQVTYEGAEGAMLAAEGQPGVVFQNVTGHRSPRWPDPAFPQQLHLDIEVTDIDKAEAEVLALGARRLPADGHSCRLYTDPDGHPFCLVW